jgi:HD-GYP domain-containing protein (c-di-GMP phosphodiesterase class II)
MMTEGYMLANCETASIIARRIGLPSGVGTGLLDTFEWWNGDGGPKQVRGEQISHVARLVNVAGYAVFFDRVGGHDAAAKAIAQRSGGYLDPAIAADFRAAHDSCWNRPMRAICPTVFSPLSAHRTPLCSPG